MPPNNRRTPDGVEVKVGQTWIDLDRRHGVFAEDGAFEARTAQVTGFIVKTNGYADEVCAVLQASSGVEVKVALRRMVSGSRGWELQG